MVENLNDIWDAVVQFVDRDDRAELADALITLAIDMDATKDDLIEAVSGNNHLSKAIERAIPDDEDVHVHEDY